MKFNYLTLENIRSYRSLHVTFPDGIVLFSGPVGSGKTTLFLAIEFALFGLQRGEVVSDMLLRHDASQGSIELGFTVDSHEVVIKRFLKRTSTGIVSDMCYLDIDGKADFFSVQELKSRVLALLRYPESLLAKKSLLFRFTLYTPQEEMKRIIQCTPDERKNILRKVFGIDTYSSIIDNTKILIRFFKDEIRDLAVRLERRPHVFSRLVSLGSELQSSTVHCHDLQQHVLQAQDHLRSLEIQWQEKQVLFETFLSLQQRVLVLRQQLSSLSDYRTMCQRRIAELTEEQQVLSSSFVSLPSISSDNLAQFKQSLHDVENQRLFLRSSLSALLAERASLLRLRDSFTQLVLCPTCEQEVPVSHKQHILTRYEELLCGFDEKEHVFHEQRLILEQSFLTRTQQYDAAEKTHKQYLEQQHLHQTLAYLQQECTLQQSYLLNHESALETVTSTLQALEQELLAYTSLSEERTILQSQLDDARSQLRSAELVFVAAEKGRDILALQLSELQSEADALDFLFTDYTQKQTYLAWLTDSFIPFVSQLEVYVLALLQRDFSLLFSQLFELLLPHALLRVSFDPDFTPCITLMDYPVSFDYLSGGERSALALAYRLSLNVLLTRHLTHSATSGVIILDEPTEGFSDEQLDSLREVFRQLALQQILLVSHERQLESFADHIFYVSKVDDTSTLLSDYPT